jgi:hypothetical protein
MTAKKFVFVLAALNLPAMLLISVLNFVIDGDSSRHLPGEPSIFPRTTNHSALSKLHYLSMEKPEVIYFGSSRTEIGLPADPDLVGGKTVYNAGLSANTLGNTLPLIQHILAISAPKAIVLGVDFVSFLPKPSPLSNLDMSLLSSDITEYRFKRLFHDIKRTLTIESTANSMHSLSALYADKPYDEIVGPASIGGQTSNAEMELLTTVRGKNLHAFQRKIQMSAGPPPDWKAIEVGLHMLDDLVASVCQRRVAIRIYTNPRHALAELMLDQNGAWPQVERWKGKLGEIATRYQPQCDIKVYDFSGYNSITTEPAVHLTPTKGLNHYWEASHYKSLVGAMILRRLFATDASTLPLDFGRELTKETVNEVNVQVRREQKDYIATHADEIATANLWASASQKY